MGFLSENNEMEEWGIKPLMKKIKIFNVSAPIFFVNGKQYQVEPYMFDKFAELDDLIHHKNVKGANVLFIYTITNKYLDKFCTDINGNVVNVIRVVFAMLPEKDYYKITSEDIKYYEND